MLPRNTATVPERYRARATPGFATDTENARATGGRALAIELGNPPRIDMAAIQRLARVPGGLVDSTQIAAEELRRGLLPDWVVCRKLPDGSEERVSLAFLLMPDNLYLGLRAVM